MLLVPCAVYAMEKAEVTFDWMLQDEDPSSVFRWGVKQYEDKGMGVGPTAFSLGVIKGQRAADIQKWPIVMIHQGQELVGFSALELLLEIDNGIGLHITPLTDVVKEPKSIVALLAFIVAQYPERTTAYTTVPKGPSALRQLVVAQGFKSTPDYKPNPLLCLKSQDNYDGFSKDLSALVGHTVAEGKEA